MAVLPTVSALCVWMPEMNCGIVSASLVTPMVSQWLIICKFAMIYVLFSREIIYKC